MLFMIANLYYLAAPPLLCEHLGQVSFATTQQRDMYKMGIELTTFDYCFTL